MTYHPFLPRMATKWRQRIRKNMTLSSSDIITIIGAAATIFFGIPAIIFFLPQLKEARRLRRERYSNYLVGKSWNNLGVCHGFPEPSLDIRINEIDNAGKLVGEVINCNTQLIDLDVITFHIAGKLTHKGTAILTLYTGVESRRIPVGVAQITYREKDNTLDFFYLHDHKLNPTLSWELGLPRFTTYGLIGC